MARTGKGVIINIGSITGLRGSAGSAVYDATKATVHSFTRSWADEYGPAGVRVNAVAPGPIATERQEEFADHLEPVLSRLPSRRMSTPEEVAASVGVLGQRRRGQHPRRHPERRRRLGGRLTPAAQPAVPAADRTRHDGRMATEIRVLDSDDELSAAANVFRTAMVGFPPLADLAPGRLPTLLEPGRTVGAFADGQLVGTADAVTSRLTLPGPAIVGHAAVTHIGVLPSFTRQGIATGLIRHQLCDFAARGEVVATLRSSEATIYGRYGYGVASSSQTVEVRTARAALRRDVGPGGPVRLLDTAQAWDVLPRIYAENRPGRPGTIDRPHVWWQGVRMRTESAPGPAYVAVHGGPGSESGFVRYRPMDTERWFVSDQRTIVVEDFFAPTAEAYLGLLRFLLGLDLVDRVVFWMLPLDDPLPWLVADRRAVRVTAVHDETWLRIIDTHAALTARGYVGDGTVTIAVNDPLLPANSARFAIAGGGATVTDRQPDLTVDVEGLGAVLLGGATWRDLALAGLARTDDPAALVASDRLFAVPEAPHAGFYF